jgi:hypothetical protein
MSARTLLDADMRTIGLWLRQGWFWWTDELRGLVPSRLRRSPLRGLPRYLMRDGRLAPLAGQRIGLVPKPGTAVTLVIPAGDCLRRTISRPKVGERDLRRMVALEADVLLPMPAESALLATRTLGPGDAPGSIAMEIAALPRATGAGIAAAALAAGAVVQAVIVEETGSDLDFAPAMREAGLLAARRSATPWLWGLVGVLLVCTIAMAIWRDAAQVAQLERLVAEQQPAVEIVQAIAHRGEEDRRLVEHSLALRRDRAPLQVLATVQHALPVGSWLQRFLWDGETVRLTGYRPERADVATALRRSGAFASVQTMGEETQAVLPTGQPFDVSARVRPH